MRTSLGAMEQDFLQSRNDPLQTVKGVDVQGERGRRWGGGEEEEEESGGRGRSRGEGGE